MQSDVDAREPSEGLLHIARRSVQKVSHLLAADLRNQIISGKLPADQQLPPEADLTERLQISRETLREALRILESQQLLEIKRGRGGGAVVRRPGLEAVGRYVGLLLQLRKTTITHLEEARSVIEPPAAELLAGRADASALTSLVALHNTEREAPHDPLAFVAAMSAFDQAITELSGNQTLAVLAGVFRDIYAGQVYVAIGTGNEASADHIARRVIVSHSAFLDAVSRGDASLAHTAWTDYLFTTGRMLLSRNVSRQPMDVTALWRDQAGRTGSEPRRASVVAAEIRARLAEGRLKEADRLPPLPELADEFGISRPTLREALRILEMEYLLDLRTGDRGGAIIRTPSTLVAARLSGIVLDARQTTVADCFTAMRLIEPAIIGLTASRVTEKQLAALRSINAALKASTDDTPRFVMTWREAEKYAFSVIRNPALTVIAEILHWIRVGVTPAITANVRNIPGIAQTNRRAQCLFAEFVSAAADQDARRATEVWDECLRAAEVWPTDSEFGMRLLREVRG